MRLSVVVSTSNEASHLRRCLTSVKTVADEIIVFDLSSTDGTVEVANSFGATVVRHPHVDYVELIREASIRAAKNDWVLLLDPDEAITDELSRNIKHLINTSEVSAYNIPRKNIFWGTWIAHTNFWPDRHIRLFQKTKIHWPKAIHTYPIVDGPVKDLPANANVSILHYGYDNFTQFFDRQNRYSSVEAENIQARRNFQSKDLFWMPLRVWLARYIKHLGFLDGYSGLFLVYGLMITQISIAVKLWEKGQN